jgi:hypothetical protein
LDTVAAEAEVVAAAAALAAVVWATLEDLVVEVSAAAASEEEALLAGSLAVDLPAVVLLVALLALEWPVITLPSVVFALASRAGLLVGTLLVEASSAAFTDGALRGAFTALVSDMAGTVITTIRAMRGRRMATLGFAVTTTGTEFVSTPIVLEAANSYLFGAISNFEEEGRVLSEVSKRAAARQQRLAAFSGEGIPPEDIACQLLCEDHVGTYTLPFLCQWSNGAWRSVETGEPVMAGVVGWRLAT